MFWEAELYDLIKVNEKGEGLDTDLTSPEDLFSPHRRRLHDDPLGQTIEGNLLEKAKTKFARVW